MIIIFISYVVVLLLPFVVNKLLGAHHARTPSLAPPQAAPLVLPIPTQADTGDRDMSAWSALDDRQLTRLLMDSAPEPPNRTQ